MNEYIDKKAADNALTAAAVADSDKKRRTWAKAIGVLHDIPAADVAPVVHGKWERLNSTQKHYCSECGMDFDLYACIIKLFNYCPYCGAKMDLKEDK